MSVLLLPVRPGDAKSQGIAFAVAAEVERFEEGSLWPGFDPARIPLAIFDGERTYLFRHPDPPSEFQPVPGRPGVGAFAGRHTLVRANTSIAVGGVPTATLLLDPGEERSIRELASIACHEMFHVFQATRHPKWGGNEVDLFTYPIDDAGQLHLSRLEEEALRRALGAKRVPEAACWASTALDLRQRRFVSLGDRGSSYERGTELKEGLARLVENRARGEKPGVSILPKDPFSAGEVRARSYAVGHALGALLDRFAAGWEKRLESGQDDRPLDVLLGEALATRKPGDCSFSRAEVDRFLAGARRSVWLAELTRQAVRKDFFARGGWKVVLVARAEPLFPEKFDPLNVERLAEGEILHTRWIKLGNSAGAVEVLDRRALTESAGTHPLFEGVKSLTVTGIEEEPQARDVSGSVSLRAPGITVDFRNARIVRENRALTILLGGSR